MKRPDDAIALVWENFGPSHVDRCDALAEQYIGRARVIGIEICGSSCAYEWTTDTEISFSKHTLFPEQIVTHIGFLRRTSRIVSACIRTGAKHVFLCHYHDPAIFCTAVLLRLAGRRPYVMNDSKFDDYQRSLWIEIAKVILHLPYVGALAGSERTRDYMRFLGVRADRIELPYNAISLARITQTKMSEDGIRFEDRHFTIVARLVPKKNIAAAITAYCLYHRDAERPRSLHIYGSGPLDAELKAQAKNEGLTGYIYFHGFVQTGGIAKALHHSLALLLPSIEEQFGFAVLEALSAGVPVILSRNCGVCDGFVRSGLNGFVVEPTNVEGIAFFMKMLASDEILWTKMRAEARTSAEAGDAKHFAAAVERLIVKTH